MAKQAKNKGPYVGYSILSLDEKHRLTLSSKIVDKLKQQSKDSTFYLSFYEEEEQRLRHLRLFDESHYFYFEDEVHPGILEEVRLQNNGRIQIPLPFYNFLGFSKDHRYTLVIADRSGYFYRLYNLAYLALDLPEHEEWGDFLPSVLEMAASCDKKLRRYLSFLAIAPSGMYRPGYEWLAEKLQNMPQEKSPPLGTSSPLPSAQPSKIPPPLSSLTSWENTMETPLPSTSPSLMDDE